MNKTLLLAVILFFAVVTSACSSDQADHNHVYQEENTILLTFQGEEHVVDFDSILELQQHEIELTVRDEDRSYKGVLLQDLLNKYDIPVDDFEQVSVSAQEGFKVALSPNEVLAEENVYIVYERDGIPKKPQEDDGSGPYRIVIREDTFAERWLKHLEEIEVIQ